MGRNISLLDRVRMASICDVGWNNMSGDDRVRFCNKCQQNVYNLTTMTPAQAEQFLVEREGKACVRAYRRFDGSILTNDCPWGVRHARRAAARVIGLAGLTLLAILQIPQLIRGKPVKMDDARALEPFHTLRQKISTIQAQVRPQSMADSQAMVP